MTNASQQQYAERPSAAERKRFGLTVAGFSLLYAVCVIFFYSSWLMGHLDTSVALFDNVLNSSMLVASLTFALLVGSKLPLMRLPYLVIGYTGLTGAVICLFLVATLDASQGLIPAAAACAGAGMSLTMPFYFESLAPFSPKRIACACGIMSLVGMALSMIAGTQPPEIMLALELAALTSSAACLIVATRIKIVDTLNCAGVAAINTPPGTAPLSKRDFLNVFLVSGVCTFALSVVYGVLDATAQSGSPSPATSTLISQFGGIAAAAVFLLYFGLRKNSSTTLLFNVVFGVLATGILFMPFLPNEYAVSLNIFAAAGWKLVMLSLFYLVVATYVSDQRRLLVGIALAYALPRFGLFVGSNTALLFAIGDLADFVRITAIAFFSLYIILMVVWFVNSHERKKALVWAKAADEKLGRFAEEQESVRKLRCEEQAHEHGLTKREGDILYLLAQGRDIVFICDTLFLSRNTVKSYQKSLYAKLGVHSKQEIIDLMQG